MAGYVLDVDDAVFVGDWDFGTLWLEVARYGAGDVGFGVGGGVGGGGGGYCVGHGEV